MIGPKTGSLGLCIKGEEVLYLLREPAVDLMRLSNNSQASHPPDCCPAPATRHTAKHKGQ